MIVDTSVILAILLGEDSKEGTTGSLVPRPGTKKGATSWGFDGEEPNYKLQRLREEWDYERRRHEW